MMWINIFAFLLDSTPLRTGPCCVTLSPCTSLCALHLAGEWQRFTGHIGLRERHRTKLGVLELTCNSAFSKFIYLPETHFPRKRLDDKHNAYFSVIKYSESMGK